MSLPKAIGQGKRKWLRVARVERKNLYTLELAVMDITIQLQQENHLRRDTSVAVPNQNLPQDIGHVKNYGQDREDPLKVHLKIDKENISIFVFII